MIPDPALERATDAATRAAADWMAANGYTATAILQRALEAGYTPELAAVLYQMTLEVAVGVQRATLAAIWPHAKRAARPPMEDGR